MKKRSVAVGETVIFILGVLIFALIIVFGYKSIGQVGEKQQQAEFIKFKTDLQGDVNKLSSEYGSVDIVEYEVPGNFEEICFFNPEGETPLDYPSSDNVIVNNAFSDGVEDVLLVGDEIQSLSMGDVKITEKVQCINIENQKLKLRLEGKGNKVSIE